MTKAELLKKLKALGKISNKQRNAVVCTLVGHSKVVTTCFGYVHCARCDAQIGDNLGSVFDLTNYVIVGHACDTCKDNYRKLDWKSKLYAVDPKVEGK